MTILYFTRCKDECRQVFIHDDGSYRINDGKLHEDANAYIKRIIRKGWTKCNFKDYMIEKYNLKRR